MEIHRRVEIIGVITAKDFCPPSRINQTAVSPPAAVEQAVLHPSNSDLAALRTESSHRSRTALTGVQAARPLHRTTAADDVRRAWCHHRTQPRTARYFLPDMTSAGAERRRRCSLDSPTRGCAVPSSNSPDFMPAPDGSRASFALAGQAGECRSACGYSAGDIAIPALCQTF
jgi:hypothetical protein